MPALRLRSGQAPAGIQVGFVAARIQRLDSRVRGNDGRVNQLRNDGWLIRALLFVPLLLLIPFTLHAEKIRTVVPQSSLNYLSVYVAESKGFFHQEGFEHETLVLAGPVAAAAARCAPPPRGRRSRRFFFKPTRLRPTWSATR